MPRSARPALRGRAATDRGVGVGVAEAQLEDLARRVPGDELARGALGREPAAVHDGQSVTELLGLVHVVGGDDLGDALLLQPVEAVPQEVASLGVEPGGGLVEDEDLGVRDERPRDREPTLHPARQRVHLVVGPLGELGELEQLLGSLADDAAGQVEVPAVDHEVVEDGQLEVERVLLGHDADPAPDLSTRRGPGPGRAPAVSRPTPGTCRRSSASSTSCRRRSGPRARRTHPGRSRSRCRRRRRSHRSAW